MRYQKIISSWVDISSQLSLPAGIEVLNKTFFLITYEILIFLLYLKNIFNNYNHLKPFFKGKDFKNLLNIFFYLLYKNIDLR